MNSPSEKRMVWERQEVQAIREITVNGIAEIEIDARSTLRSPESISIPQGTKGFVLEIDAAKKRYLISFFRKTGEILLWFSFRSIFSNLQFLDSTRVN